MNSKHHLIATVILYALAGSLAVARATETKAKLDRELKYISVSEFLPVAADALARYNDGSKTKPEFKRLHSNSEVESIKFGETLILGDTQLNRIIAVGKSEHLRVIDQLLDELDRRDLQVHLLTFVVRIDRTKKAPTTRELLRSVEEVQVGGHSVSLPELLHLHQRPGGSDLTIIDPAPPYSNKVPDHVALLAGDSLLRSYAEALEAKASVRILSRAHYTPKPNEPIALDVGCQVIPLIVSDGEIVLQLRSREEALREAFRFPLDNRVPRIGSSTATTVRLWSGGIVITPEFGARSDEYETLLFLQPFLIDAPKD